MPLVLSDAQIQTLLDVPKRIVNPGARVKTQRGSELTNYDAVGDDGSQFKIYVRQNKRIAENFSCGLLFIVESGDTVTLTRYNGNDHVHSNPLDSVAPRHAMECHIHRATERYIAAGRKAEHYAETTDRYTDLQGAVRALLFDCKIGGLDPPPTTNQILLL